MRVRASFLILFSSLISVGLAACDNNNDLRWWSHIPGYNGYWWHRGQPRSTAQLVEHAQEKLGNSLTSNSSQRPDLAPAADEIQKSLTSAYQRVLAGGSAGDIAGQLGKTEAQLIEIESHLSIGSRAAYGELSGEMRAFTDKLQSGQDVHDESFREAFALYTSRVLSFLANELTVPAPVVS